MSTLDRIIIFLNKLEARDKMCGVVQFGARFLGNGQPGVTLTVAYNTIMARRVFRLFKVKPDLLRFQYFSILFILQYLNNFQNLISPSPSGTSLLIVLLDKLENAFTFTFFFLDEFVWLGKLGIIKNKRATDVILRIALYCFLGSSISTTALKIAKLGKPSSSKKKIKMELKDDEKHQQDKMCEAKLIKISFMKILSLIKSIMDIVVAIGALQLVPRIITTRVTGAFGVMSSLISCYKLFPSRLKCKTS